MRLLQGRAAMRCMPSRRHFAIFRLVAFLRLRTVRVTGEPDRVLSIDRHQSALEMYGVGVWLVLTLACFLGALLSEWGHVPWPLALLLAVPLAWTALQAATILTALVVPPLVRFLARRPGQNNIRINSFTVMLLFFTTAAYFATQRTWARFAAWQFLAAVGLNAVAAAIVFLLGGEISRLESSLGGETSESSSLRSR